MPRKKYYSADDGRYLDNYAFKDKSINDTNEMKIMRIVKNLEKHPHYDIVWDDIADLYSRKIEKCQSLLRINELGFNNELLAQKMDNFLDMCRNPEFQIAFVGTIKTGKSTLINALLGHEYASMAVTPETAALTKFRSSEQDYVKVAFYSTKEWDSLWKSISSGADKFLEEYHRLNANSHKGEWVGHKTIIKKLKNEEITTELSKWSSSQSPEHYFVKEIEVGISTLPQDFPKQVVFVDTPGLSDPVAYRSKITQKYISKANAVFMCINADKIYQEEMETISTVFSLASNNKSKVHIIATHWDTLNNPNKDWERQYNYLCNQLVGKAYFDTKEMAMSNITYSSAYIYNKCLECSGQMSQQDINVTFLPFLIKMHPENVAQIVSDVKSYIGEMKIMSNIPYIHSILNSRIVANYSKLLMEDIEKKYKEIIFDLRRFTKETADSTDKLIEASSADITELEKKLNKEQQNVNKVNHQKAQLQALIDTVIAMTDKRVSELESQINSIK